MAAKKPPAVLSRPNLVLVIWEDATELDTEAWVRETVHDYKPDLAIVHSVGFLLNDSKLGVVISPAWCEDGQMLGRREQIPRGMIRKITVLKG
jgi:hypothetical protein